ncbi:hypothetical protein GLAREA_06046 [Glarea lozoyensis ATCC 20868]|uniref:Uncharacterized protein n=1 Tax=Glarea lozoyensis (strain ATCC 20868 / MF5171) TaxID=1116229 RepID=S3D7B8_GLAL2|nr:uncharacterized protein GLAREA_06046 [Glarea lozoyensis ATCC 20868]EPE33034.1 hypothetical protein GLAREA_06046 [Glarea lozoyensis ATCC 20868]
MGDLVDEWPYREIVVEFGGRGTGTPNYSSPDGRIEGGIRYQGRFLLVVAAVLGGRRNIQAEITVKLHGGEGEGWKSGRVEAIRVDTGRPLRGGMGMPKLGDWVGVLE